MVTKNTQNLGLNYLNSSPKNIKQNLTLIKQRIHDQAIQNQQSILRENKKLEFYNYILNFNVRPPYVDICKYKADRSKICKYRISAHSLAIERGRYKNIPQNHRTCTKCTTSQIENEEHFFIYCPTYTSYRQELITKINITSITINKLRHILNSSSLILLKALIEYIDKCESIKNITVTPED